MKRQLISILSAMMLLIGITGCSSNDSTILSISTNNIDKEQLREDTIKFLKGIEASELESYSDNIEIQWEDICNLAENANTYVSYSAYYLQYGEYMYRFQLNNDGKVVSYIKYKVEA